MRCKVFVYYRWSMQKGGGGGGGGNGGGNVVQTYYKGFLPHPSPGY